MTGHRFLIVRLGSLGDVIHAIPAAAALRAHFPRARIDWATDPKYVELLEMVRGVDGRVAIDTRRPAATVGTLRTLRRVRYQAAIDLQGLVKSAVLARAVGAERTIGFPGAHLRERLARVFYTHTPDPPEATHVILKNLALLATLGIRDRRVEFPLDIVWTDTAEQVASRGGSGGYALINPGAAWPNKRWPASQFGAVAALMRERHGLHSVVVWGPGEESLAAEVARAAEGAADVAPPTTVTDLFAIAKGARLMVSGDTGPLHIAAAVGTPVVALFGPTRAERNGPWAESDISISRAATCSCPYQRRCRRSQPCITEISVAEVMDGVDRRLSAHG